MKTDFIAYFCACECDLKDANIVRACPVIFKLAAKEIILNTEGEDEWVIAYPSTKNLLNICRHFSPVLLKLTNIDYSPKGVLRLAPSGMKLMMAGIQPIEAELYANLKVTVKNPR